MTNDELQTQLLKSTEEVEAMRATIEQLSAAFDDVGGQLNSLRESGEQLTISQDRLESQIENCTKKNSSSSVTHRKPTWQHHLILWTPIVGVAIGIAALGIDLWFKVQEFEHSLGEFESKQVDLANTYRSIQEILLEEKLKYEFLAAFDTSELVKKVKAINLLGKNGDVLVSLVDDVDALRHRTRVSFGAGLQSDIDNGLTFNTGDLLEIDEKNQVNVNIDNLIARLKHEVKTVSLIGENGDVLASADVTAIAGRGLEESAGTLRVGSGDGINVNDDHVEVEVDSTKALSVDSMSGVQVVVDTNSGLQIDSTDGLQAKIGSTLQFDGNGNLSIYPAVSVADLGTTASFREVIDTINELLQNLRDAGLLAP